MKELGRLLRFARPYWAALLASTVLMAGVGAGQALVVLLVRSVFDRVLQPDTPDALVLLVNIPVIHKALYLQQIVPSFLHNVWTMVAAAIVEVYLFKGLCDYLGISSSATPGSPPSPTCASGYSIAFCTRTRISLKPTQPAA